MGPLLFGGETTGRSHHGYAVYGPAYEGYLARRKKYTKGEGEVKQR
jgi:hypothetical protein